MPRFVFFTLLLFLSACHALQPASQNPAALLVGRWEMTSVLEEGVDVTKAHDPSDNRWIDFSADGTFVSDGDPHGRNTGRWTLHTATNELYLDSNADEGDDSYWIITMDNTQMHWKGTRSDFTERFELIHTRK